MALVVAVAAGLVAGWWLSDRQPGGTQAGDCASGAALRLAVAPEFGPVAEQAAKDVGGDGSCPAIAVSAEQPADTVAGLAKSRPDGWVAPSSAWLRVATGPTGKSGGSPGPAPSGSAAYFSDEAVSLARTPVVVAAPRPFAESLGWPAKQPGWAELATLVIRGEIPRFSMENPLRGTAGLLGVLGVYAAMAKTTTDEGIAQMRALTLRSRLADPEADPAGLLDRMRSQTDPAMALRSVGVFPVTEQALWAYQKKEPPVALAALYPADGLVEADYPLVLSKQAAADEQRRDLADRLIERMRSPELAETLAAQGFRPPAGAAASASPPDGLLAQYPPPTKVSTGSAAVLQQVSRWAGYKRLAYQVLLLVDASASMNDPVRTRSGKLTTKAGLLREAGTEAARLFGLDTSLALWHFATPQPTSPPYTEVIPFGPLDKPVGGMSRREALQRAAAGYRAYDRAGTPMYETVLRGTGMMRQRVKRDTVTLVVVLTDGRDEDTRYAMSRAEFLSRLAGSRNPNRPVPVFAIGYGADADMGVLNAMAKTTGGRAAASNDPGDLASAMARIFLAAHSAD